MCNELWVFANAHLITRRSDLDGAVGGVMRFVILVFFLLALAFYQMSGGADFVPRSQERQEMAASEPEPQKPTPTARPVAKRSEQQDITVAPIRAAATTRPQAPDPQPAAEQSDPSPLFRRPSNQFEPQTVTLVSLEDNPAVFAQPVDQDAETSVEINVSPSMAAALSSPVTGAPNSTAPTTPPGAQVARAEIAPQTDIVPPKDIRRVKGARVNLRGGPGTTFKVLASLGQDTEVEVLEDPGQGWVRLRPVAGGPTGWMAAYLLTN